MFLGLDLGTSAVKAVLLGSDGELVESAEVALSVERSGPVRAEQHPAKWWRAVRQAVLSLNARERAQAIGVTGQMHGAVLLDKGGEVLAPVILWQDTRAINEARTLDALGLSAVAGVRPTAKFPAAKLLWLKRHSPEVYAQIACILAPKDWLGFRLHGERVTDPSDAAGTWWFDQALGVWSEGLTTGIDAGWLPEVRAADQVAGQLQRDVADELGLPPGLPVAVGAGDTMAAMMALGLAQPGRGFLGVSTSGQVATVCAKYDPEASDSVHNFAFGLEGLWVQMAALQSGAAPLAHWARRLGGELETLLAHAADVDSRLAPHFSFPSLGEAPSAADPLALGLCETPVQDAGLMMRGLVDSIAAMYGAGAKELGAMESVLAAGGGTRSPLLMQALANALGVPVDVSGTAARGASVGAALLAGIAAGALPTSRLATSPPIARRFEPDRDRCGFPLKSDLSPAAN
jgi:xylulokinase